MAPTALITGICGQDGSFLAKFLLQKNYQVIGLCLPNSSTENLDHFQITNSVKLIECDITNKDNLEKSLQKTNPTEIYHLAAFSSPGQSWTNIAQTTEINSTGAANLFELIQKNHPQTKLFNASSREIFGDNHQNGIQTEETALSPKTPYGSTKALAHNLVQNIREHSKAFFCNGILYNHESPLRPNHFVTRKITQSIAEIALGKKENIELMNISSMRDWGYAGDFVEAMWLTLQQDKPNDYIISTATNHTIHDLLTIGFQHIGVKDWTTKVKITADTSRPAEPQIPIGNNSRITNIGWKPKTSFEQLIIMMITADLHCLKNN